MDRAAGKPYTDHFAKLKRTGTHRLLLQVAELQIENERLREDNMQLRAALSIFSEVAKRSLTASPETVS